MKQILTLFSLGALLLSGIVLAQSLTNKPLFEAKSIKVVANEKFPEDLECEVFIGPKNIPYFRTKGKENQVNKFTIDTVGSGPSVSMIKKEAGPDSYVLSLFTEDSEGKVLMFFDFNFDGVWDLKRAPTREQKNFIFFNNEWLGVALIDGILSTKPIAERKGFRYEFRGEWKLIK